MSIKKIVKTSAGIMVGNRNITKRELKRMSKSGQLKILCYDERLGELEWADAPDWSLINRFGISNGSPLYYTTQYLEQKTFQKLPVIHSLARLAVNICYVDD